MFLLLQPQQTPHNRSQTATAVFSVFPRQSRWPPCPICPSECSSCCSLLPGHCTVHALLCIGAVGCQRGACKGDMGHGRSLDLSALVGGPARNVSPTALPQWHTQCPVPPPPRVRWCARGEGRAALGRYPRVPLGDAPDVLPRSCMSLSAGRLRAGRPCTPAAGERSGWPGAPEVCRYFGGWTIPHSHPPLHPLPVSAYRSGVRVRFGPCARAPPRPHPLQSGPLAWHVRRHHHVAVFWTCLCHCVSGSTAQQTAKAS